MPKIDMYAGINNSPQTVTTAEITASAQSIPVSSTAVFPAGPNLATLGTGDDAEVVQYTAISGNELTGCVRGFGGTTAKIWPTDTVVYRAFTLEDYRRLCANIDALFSEKLATNGEASDAVVAFTQASARANVGTGETLAVLVGKLAKWYADLKGVAWSGSYNDLSNKPGSMTPTAHAATHGADGSDPLTPDSINAQAKIESSGILKGDGAGGVSTAQAGTDYQAAIKATGLLKGSGNGVVGAAQAGTDYQAPITQQGILKGTGSGVTGAEAGTDYQAPISATGLLKGAGNGSVSAATAGEDYQAPITVTGLLKGNGSTVQQAVAGTDYAKPSNTVYATLLATGWTFDIVNDTGAATRVVPEPGTTGAYQQTVSVAGITENSTAIVSLSPLATAAQFQAAVPLQLIAVEQGEGTITVRIGASYSTTSAPSIDPPTVDIPIQVTIL